MTPRLAGARRVLLAVGHPVTLILAMVVAFFYREVFLGRVFSPADQLYTYPPWNAFKPTDYRGPSNLLRSDDTFIGFPHKVTIAADLKQFGVTLWQHHTLAGSANSFSLHLLGGFAYPPLLGFLFLDRALANTLLYMSMPFAATLSAYLFVGQLARSRWARLFGAIAYGFSGYLVGWLSAFALPVIYACLPLALYLLTRWMRERRPWLGVLYSLVVAVTLFMGYPPANIVMGAYLVVFAAAWAARREARPGTLTGFAWYTALGLLGGAAAAVPTFAQLTHFAGETYRGVLPPIPPQALITYLFPNVFGNPTVTAWRGPGGNFSEYVAYAGGMTVVLAVVGVAVAAARRTLREPLVLAALGICLLSGLMAYGAFPLSLLSGIPPFNNISPSRWQMGIDLALAMLATIGLDALVQHGLSLAGRWAVAVGIASVAGLAAGMVLAGPGLLFGAGDFIAGDALLRLGLLAAGAVMLLLVLLPPGRLSLVAPGLLVGILFIDMFTFGVDFNPAIAPRDFYPSTPATAFLAARAGGHRVLPIKGGFFGDVLNVYGVDTVTGYDHFRDDAYIRQLRPLLSDHEVDFWRRSGYLLMGDSVDLTNPLLDLLDVKFVYYPAGEVVPSVPGRFAEVYRGPDGTVLENEHGVAAQYHLSATGELQAVSHQEVSPGFDQLRVSGPGALVLDRPYSPAWRITVNGRDVAAKRYRGFFLTVPLVAGTNVVELHFEPPEYGQGLALSLVALVLALVSLASPLLGRAWGRRPGRHGAYGPQSNQPRASTTTSVEPARL